MPSALSTIKALDAATPLLPLVANPAIELLQVPPYWWPECLSDECETNLPAAAALIAAAWCQTGGRHQHRGCLALLQGAGMTAAAARRLLEQARQTAGEPTHGVVVGMLRRRLGSAIAAGL